MKRIIVVLLTVLLVSALPTNIDASSEWTVVINGSRHNRCSADLRSVSVKDDGDQWIIRFESWNNWKLLDCGDFVMMFLYINTSATRNFDDSDYALMFTQIGDSLMTSSLALKGGPGLSLRSNFNVNESTGTVTIKKSDLRAPNARFSLLFRIAELNREIEIAPPSRQMAIYRSTAKQPEGKLIISKNTFDFSIIKKDQIITDIFDLINDGMGEINVQISSTPNIDVDKTRVTLGDYDRVAVSLGINAKRLSPRSFEEKITIQSDKGNHMVTVKFTILPDPKLEVDRKTIDFGKIYRRERNMERVVISNANPGDIKVTISTNTRWITINKRSFTSNSDEILIGINTDQIPKDRQTGSVTINSNGGREEIVVHAELIDSFLCLTKELDFGTVDIDQKIEKNGQITVQNISDREVKIVAQTDANWIDFKERELTLLPLQTQQFVVEVNPKYLNEPNQLYRGLITLRSPFDTYEVKTTLKLVQTPPQLTWVNDDGKKQIEKTIHLGQTAEINVKIKNTGVAEMHVNPNLENVRDREFRIFTLPFSLKANESEEIIVRFDSSRRKPGTYKATLQIESNGGNLDIPLMVEVLEKPTITIQLFIGKLTAFIDKKELQLDAPPYINQGTTMVPLRFIGEAFNAEVEWLPLGAGRIIVKLSDKTIRLDIGSSKAYINDKAHALSAPPEIRNGRTFVPVRFISEGFGAKVEWDAGQQKVTITFEGKG